MTVRAVLYLRVSLDSTGEGLAVDRQREECQRIARERGWVVAGEYVDNSVSASSRTKKRPAYSRMVADFEAGGFDALLCWDLDRLTRQTRELEDWIDRAETRGLRLVTANGEADLGTDAGRLFARIKAAVSRAEIERKSARRRAANKQKVEAGGVTSGARLFGFASPNGSATREQNRTSPEQVEAEALEVRWMFQQFAEGESLRGLCASLNARDVQTRAGGSWSPSTVLGLLRNPRYAGWVERDGERFDGGWAPLVDEALFAVVQSILDDPGRRTQAGTDRKHLGSGLYLCGVCGDVLTSFSGGRYRCRVCAVSRRMAPIDALVVELVEGRLADPSLPDFLAPGKSAEVLELTKAKAGLRNRMRSVEADYDAGLIDGRRLKAATDRIAVEIASVDAKLAVLVGAPSGGVLSLPEDRRVDAFRAASLMIQREVVHTLLEVRVFPAPRGRRGFDPDTVETTWK